jgi:hypothetical protein
LDADHRSEEFQGKESETVTNDRGGKNVTTTKKIAKKPQNKNWVIVGKGTWGLWFGWITDKDATDPSLTSVRLNEARNIRYWHGRIGGITSLAAFGPCGSRFRENRIGAAIPWSNLNEVKAVHACTSEAVRAFASVDWQ